MLELSSLSFARPLWLLALLPAAVVLVLLYRRGWRLSGWEPLLPAALRPWLLQQHAGGTHALRFAILGLVWTLAVLALAGPLLHGSAQPHRLSDSAVVIVLEVSRNMLSDDLAPNRLQRSKHKIRTLMQDYPDSQLALVAFAGSAHRVSPLSRDRNTLRSLLTALEPDIMPVDGQNLDQAMTLARQMLDGQPQSASRILLVTSGLDGEQRKILDGHARELGAQLAILGVGTSAGAPVPLAEGGFMRDSEGRILLPRLNGQQLAAVARQHGSRYHGITVGNRDLDYLLQPMRTVATDPGEGRLPLDQGHWLVLLLLPLAALGARRGWLGVLLVAALLPPPAQALSWADLWQRPDQQAMQLLEQQQPGAAAERFVDPQWQAWALYQAGDYEQAAARWAELLAAAPDNPEYHFNLGTAQAMAGHLPEALEAYEQALTRDPDHTAARHNRGVIEALLEQLRQQQEQQAAGADEAGDGATPEVPGGATPADTSSPSNGNGDTGASTPPPADEGSGGPSAATEPAPAGGTAGLAQDSAAGKPGAAGAEPSAGGAPGQPSGAALEQRQALQQWLQDIPDDPAELLRRKFLYQHLQQQESPR